MDRKMELLDIGARMASKIGAANVTRRAVAIKAGVSDALVAHYLGSTAEAQKKYAARAKKLGLTLPDKAKVEAIGTKLRAHGPRDKRDTRKRSAREVEAIRNKQRAADAMKNNAKIAKMTKGKPSVTKRGKVQTIDAKTLKVVKPKATLNQGNVAVKVGNEGQAITLPAPQAKALPGPTADKAISGPVANKRTLAPKVKPPVPGVGGADVAS